MAGVLILFYTEQESVQRAAFLQRIPDTFSWSLADIFSWRDKQRLRAQSFGRTATRPSEDGAPSGPRCPVTPTKIAPWPPIEASRPPLPPTV